MSIFSMCTTYISAICVSFFLIYFSCAHATNRQINCTVHPEYNSTDNEALNLVHVVAIGANDVVHYLWSSYKLPSVIVARTTIDTQLIINSKKLRSFENGAIKFTKEPLALTGLTISELLEMSYNSDTADVTDVMSVHNLGLEFFQWFNATNETLSCSDSFASITMKSSENEETLFSKKGIFGVQFSVMGKEEAASDPPHLIFTGNSTQVKVSIDDMKSNSTRTRYGIELILFSPMPTKCPDMTCKAVTVGSVSDEFSPGIFSDVDILTPCSQQDNEKSSFLTWRPVAYTSTETSVANSSDAKLTSNCKEASASSIRSIAELYFNDPTHFATNIFNVTFGTVGDGFYPKTEYTAWTFMLGTGISVHSKLSITAIVFASVGVGATSLSLLVGVVYLAVRWCRQKDDDLLLSENCVN